eukprot:6183645-Pleurochrysis_carterae.AAC.3
MLRCKNHAPGEEVRMYTFALSPNHCRQCSNVGLEAVPQSLGELAIRALSSARQMQGKILSAQWSPQFHCAPASPQVRAAHACVVRLLAVAQRPRRDATARAGATYLRYNTVLSTAERDVHEIRPNIEL